MASSSALRLIPIRKFCLLWLSTLFCLLFNLPQNCYASSSENFSEEPEILTITEKNDNDSYNIQSEVVSKEVDLYPGLRHLSRRNFDENIEETYDYTRTELILVATIDGSLHGVDRSTGNIKWSQKVLKSPLVSTHHSYIDKPFEEPVSDILDDFEDDEKEDTSSYQFKPDERIFIPEPGGSGNLYYLSTQSKTLKKFPITIKNLINQTPFRFQKRIYLAEKRTDFVVLDAFSGELIKSPGAKKLSKLSPHSALNPGSFSYQPSARGVILGYAIYDIKVYDELSDELLWNITLTDFCPDMLAQANARNIEVPKYKIPTVKIEADIFSSPIIFAFDVVREESSITKKAGSLVTKSIPLSFFSSSTFSNNLGSAYIGHQNGSVYALTPKLFPYLPSSKFFPKLQLSHSQSHDLILYPEHVNSGSPLVLTEIHVDTPEVLLTLPEPKRSHKKTIWALIAIFISICGLRELFNLKLVKKILDSKANTRKVKSQKKVGNTVSLPEKPTKALALENGSTLIGSITISKEILGYGSHGTIVFKGQFQNREVAVKRMLLDLVNIAEHEVQTLEDSDDHPFVIRYYAMERCDSFMYLALELCPTSLQGLIEDSQKLDFPVIMSPQQILYQIMSGLHHLHQLKIVHRDIKPQNILLGKSLDRFGQLRSCRMLISDFGLCKRLEEDQSSFHFTLQSGAAAGTMGWRAPECLLNSSALLAPPESDHSSSSNHSSITLPNLSPSKSTGRITRALDIFSTGCVFYYVLSLGLHPFGERYAREGRVVEGKFDIDLLLKRPEIICGFEAHDLIKQMLDPNPSLRPDSLTILLHPYFWDSSKKLNFLQDISDQIEGELRVGYRGERLGNIEEGAEIVLGGNWLEKMDKRVLTDLHKFRGYDGTKVRDLLRVIRNKKHHYADLPPFVKRAYGSLPDDFLNYFLSRFPALVLHVYYALARHPTLPKESIFRPYFRLPEYSQ